jgi:hypothetical protein
MIRDNKGRYSKSKRDDEDYAEDIPTTSGSGRFLDKPPSIKSILIFLFLTWLSTFIFPGLKEETTRKLTQHICHSEETYKGDFVDLGRAKSNTSHSIKDK